MPDRGIRLHALVARRARILVAPGVAPAMRLRKAGVTTGMKPCSRTRPIGGILRCMSKIWFGLHLPNYTFPDRDPARLFDQAVVPVQAAEQAGCDLVTVMDHLNQIPGIGHQDEPMLEGWSALAGFARETKRVNLGTLVTGVTYRNPALLAKTATTLDVISGGRAIFG